MKVLDVGTTRFEVFGTLAACEQKAVDLLVKEVEARTGLNWQNPLNKTSQATIIAVHHAAGVGPAEVFRLTGGKSQS